MVLVPSVDTGRGPTPIVTDRRRLAESFVTSTVHRATTTFKNWGFPVPRALLAIAGLMTGLLFRLTSSGAAALPPGSAVRLDNSAQLDEVVVTGERPGPRMWKVTKGDHVLWILGTMDVLPKRMTWRSEAVEAVLRDAQEVIPGRPSFDVSLGPIEAFRLYRQFKRLEKLAAGVTLQATLPSTLYARYAVLKQRYAPRDGKQESLRPMFVADRLYDAAIDSSGLTSRESVQPAVLKLAKQRKVTVHRVQLKIADPRAILNELGAMPPATEQQCLATTIERLETDVAPMRQRAVAWANGDVARLRALPYPDNMAACWQALASSARIRELRERGDTLWLAAVEDALARNATTLALHSIRELLAADGLQETFRRKGYLVEDP
jgi:uncharacterized protein YbaP (TraB family)